MSQLSSGSSLIMQMLTLSSKVTKSLDGQLSAHGISLTEYMIMHHLAGSALNTMRRIELAEHVGISASGVTRLIAPMEKIKIVEKQANPRDARQSLVKLTKVGHQLYKDARVSFEACADNLLADLSVSQQGKFLELSAKIL